MIGKTSETKEMMTPEKIPKYKLCQFFFFNIFFFKDEFLPDNLECLKLVRSPVVLLEDFEAQAAAHDFVAVSWGTCLNKPSLDCNFIDFLFSPISFSLYLGEPPKKTYILSPCSCSLHMLVKAWGG